MTLLFLYVDDNYVMQIADERISKFNIKINKWQVRDDNTPKQILLRSSIIISFTGVATIGRQTTTEWLARKYMATEEALDSITADVANRLTEIFRRPPYDDQLLTVLIAGWSPDTNGKLRPVLGHMSNQDPSSYERLEQFEHLVGVAPPGASWMTRGQPLPEEVDRDLRRRIPRALEAGVSPPVMQRLLLGAMRATSAKNQFVGPSALIGVMPRAGVEWAAANPDKNFVFANDSADLIPGAIMFVRVPAGTDRTEPFHPVVV